MNSISSIFHKFLNSDLTSYLRLKYLPIATPCDHPWIMSLHWRPNNLLLIRWCISQLQHFVASASNFLIGHLLPISVVSFLRNFCPSASWALPGTVQSMFVLTLCFSTSTCTARCPPWNSNCWSHRLLRGDAQGEVDREDDWGSNLVSCFGPIAM